MDRSEERQKSDDFISVRLHANLKAVTSEYPFGGGCIGVVVRELLLYWSEVESEVTAHDLFHSCFETNWGIRTRQTKRIEGSP